jgi:lipoprotein-anchoring transpeptidase ErfK/SrfK
MIMADLRLRLSLINQRLEVLVDGECREHFQVSTSRYGPAEWEGSQGTPRGRHYIRAKIGAGLPPGAVLRGRRPTGEIWSAALAAQHPGRDWILSRILWLCGREPGRNRLNGVDSMRRYIYIHGTPDTEPMGVPFSHGCIRMRNDDVIRLFDLVEAGTEIDIVP